MFTLRQILPALCVTTALSATTISVSAVYADSPAAAPDAVAPGAPPAGGWRHGAHDGGAFGPMGRVLHQLNLTADQKAQIKSIMAGQKSQFEPLRASP